MKTKKYILMVSMGLLFSFSARAELAVRCDNLVGGVAVSPDGKFVHKDRAGTKTALVPVTSGSKTFKIRDGGIYNSNSKNQYHVQSSNEDGKPTEVIVSKYIEAEMASEIIDYSYKLDYSSNGNCYVKSVSDITVKGKESILFDTALCKKTVDEFKQINLSESEAKKCSSAFQKITMAMDDYRKTLSLPQRIWSDLVDKSPMKSAMLFMSKCRELLGGESTAFAHFDLTPEVSLSTKPSTKASDDKPASSAQ